MTFYDSHGKATAYLHDDGIHIYLFNGRPVAYLYDDAFTDLMVINLAGLKMVGLGI